jgi:hypothetical protein
MPPFYGVGALEGLRGEISIFNSEAILTSVSEDRGLQSVPASGAKATLLVGQSVSEWSDTYVSEAISFQEFERSIAELAASQGVDQAKPFMFVIEGEFTDVRLHVINGACPIHSRIRKIAIAEGDQPFELEANNMSGILVAVYAEDAVGTLTHPTSTTHAHLVFADEATRARVTGHGERIGLAKGAVLKLPKQRNDGNVPENHGRAPP